MYTLQSVNNNIQMFLVYWVMGQKDYCNWLIFR